MRSGSWGQVPRARCSAFRSVPSASDPPDNATRVDATTPADEYSAVGRGREASSSDRSVRPVRPAANGGPQRAHVRPDRRAATRLRDRATCLSVRPWPRNSRIHRVSQRDRDVLIVSILLQLQLQLLHAVGLQQHHAPCLSNGHARLVPTSQGRRAQWILGAYQPCHRSSGMMIRTVSTVCCVCVLQC
jgi:hypothetical protein